MYETEEMKVSMTKEQILAMEAGSDLNWLICTEVFGGKTLGSVKPYSTDISAAWQMVEKMVAEYGDFVIDYDDSYNGGKWSASVDKLRVGVLAKTAEEAICKAALLTKIRRS